MFIWYALNCSQWYCFRYIFNKMKLRNSWLSFKAYIAFLQHDYSSNCHVVLAGGYNGYFKHSDHLLLIKLWHTRLMICLSNYLLCLCLTPKLVSFFSWIIVFLSKLLPVTRRSSFLSKGLPHIFCLDPVNTSNWSPISFCMNFY